MVCGFDASKFKDGCKTELSERKRPYASLNGLRVPASLVHSALQPSNLQPPHIYTWQPLPLIQQTA